MPIVVERGVDGLLLCLVVLFADDGSVLLRAAKGSGVVFISTVHCRVVISDDTKSSYTSLKVHGEDIVRWFGFRRCFAISFQ